jgi:uncharacterized membrane protein
MDMEELTDLAAASTPLMGTTGLLPLLMHFFFNLLVVAIIIHFFYYKKSKRRDFYFTFILISISIFLMIYLLGDVKIKVGFALGLFAIFGIIRYRTESMPVREMTYLFVIIAISVINALVTDASYLEQIATNLLFIVSVWICESNHWLRHISEKLVQYDHIELITPEHRDELKKDLEKRLGLKILRVEVGHVDFVRDTAILKVFYEPERDEINTTDTVTKLPKDDD